MLIGQCLGWGTGSPCTAGSGAFLWQIPTAAAVSLRVVLGSSAKILEGSWPRCPCMPGQPLSWPRPLLPVTARAGDELLSPPGPWAVGGTQGVIPRWASHSCSLGSQGDAFPRQPPACPPSVQRGELGWSCLCGHPSGPLDFSHTPFLHPWPAVSSPQEQQISANMLFHPPFALFHKAFCRLFGTHKSSHAG